MQTCAHLLAEVKKRTGGALTVTLIMQNVSQNVTQTVTGSVTKDKYQGEDRVHWLIVIFMLVTGLYLAWITGENWFVKIGQMFGFGTTTYLIITVYKGIKEERYTGNQYKYAERLYNCLLVDEGLTIFAKMVPEFRPVYLALIAISIPILAYSAFKLIRMDDQVKLARIKRDNEHRDKYAREMRSALKRRLALDKEIAVLTAAEITQYRRNEKLLKKASGRRVGRTVEAAARSDLSEVYDYLDLHVTTKTHRKKRGLLKGRGEVVRVEDLSIVPSGDGQAKKP